MGPYDAVFVGSGINALAGGALLAKAGWRVCILERNDRLGGAIRTEEGLDRARLHARGLQLLAPALHRLGGLRGAEGRPRAARARVPQHRPADRLARSRTARARSSRPRSRTTSPSSTGTQPGDGAAWQAAFEGFMANADLSFGVLVDRALVGRRASASRRRPTAASAAAGCSAYGGEVLSSCRDWLGDTFASPQAHGLLAPWVLHTGLGPEQPLSGFMTKVIGAALQLGGMPVPKGGGVELVEALAAIVREAGGELRTDAEVERILVADGRATAVRLAGGEAIAGRAGGRSPASRRRSSTAGCSPSGEVPPSGPRRGGPLPLRPRRACRSTSR